MGTADGTFKGDSLVIKFNDGKVMSYKCTSINSQDFFVWTDDDCSQSVNTIYNPLIEYDYKETSFSESKITVTKEDYNLIP